MKKIKLQLMILFMLILIFGIMAGKKRSYEKIASRTSSKTQVKEDSVGNTKNIKKAKFDINPERYQDFNVVESKVYTNGRHSVKYYSYQAETLKEGELQYRDVSGNLRGLLIDSNVNKNEYEWEGSVYDGFAPKGYEISYGIDVSHHNKIIDWQKVKNAGFEFAFIRIMYRGYGYRGSLNVDERALENLKNAKSAGLQIGAYVFSQATNANEALEEAKFSIELLSDIELDLPLVFDPETIKTEVSRTDDVKGEQFTKNAIAFCDYVKARGYKTAIYSNLVWEDYYFDMAKLNDYEIWYADYEKFPQTPYHFTYWQFTEAGIVDGIEGNVDLNVWIKKK